MTDLLVFARVKKAEKMSTIPTFDPVSLFLPTFIESENAGCFVSRGYGRHPERIINSYELIFISRSSLCLTEEDKETSCSFTVSKGEYLILFPGKRHWSSVSYKSDLEFYWIHFRLVPDSFPLLPTPNLVLPRCGRIVDEERFIELFCWFLDAQEKGTLSQSIANTLCLLMLQLAAADAVQTNSSSPLASQAHLLITTHFSKNISTFELSQTLQCNPDYLGRIYKENYGMTIVESLQQCKIKLARKLLLQEHLSIAAISQSCGYKDSTYFRRIFKKMLGINPSVFRKLHTQRHINTE